MFFYLCATSIGAGALVLTVWMYVRQTRPKGMAAVALAVLNHALDSLKKHPASNSDRESSRAYLVRPDVRQQTTDLFTALDADFSKGYEEAWADLLGLTFLEIKIRTKKGESWTLNYWPCSQCACVGSNPTIS